jgi:membrane protein implicated in regulation of membrane protease activity
LSGQIAGLDSNMEHLLAILSSFGPWNWFCLVVVLFFLDLIVPGVHFLWFRIASAATGVLALATDIAWQWQILAFGFLSVAAALWVRRYAQPDVVRSDVPDLNARPRQYIGRLFVVAEAIDCGRGKVRVGDTLWAAEGPDAPVGARVMVTGTRGTALVVERPRARSECKSQA